jgi:hypothetical protein
MAWVVPRATGIEEDETDSGGNKYTEGAEKHARDMLVEAPAL